MNYVSTRNKTKRVNAAEAILCGLAPDGGLYVPEHIPALSQGDLSTLCGMDYAERAAWIMSRYLGEFSVEELTEFARKAYSGEKFSGQTPAPVKKVGNSYYLELWHGPTCAFKDMALQMLPHLISASLKKTGQSQNAFILTATSGDTGKAALEGFRDVDRTKIMVFYPADGVSDVQAMQMNTQKGSNVFVQAVQGNFDDTQTGVKKIFSDRALAQSLQEAGWQFSSANSINWGRLLPQIVYYVSAYCDLIGQKEIAIGDSINFCVPTGNFGNILSAYYAKKMGIPINKLICASNSNNVLTEFIKTGRYDRNRQFYCTISPSMDILISSNLERLLFDLSGRDDTAVRSFMEQLAQQGVYAVPASIQEAMSELIWAGYCTEDDTKAAIERVWAEDRYLIDPHTAVAVDVKQNYDEASGDLTKTIIVSTANPYKFGEAVLDAIGVTTSSDTGEINGIELIDLLHEATGLPIPMQIQSLKSAEVRFSGTILKQNMADQVLAFLHS